MKTKIAPDTSDLKLIGTIAQERAEALALRLIQHHVRQQGLCLLTGSLTASCNEAAQATGVPQEILEDFAVRVLIPALMEKFNLKVIRMFRKSKVGNLRRNRRKNSGLAPVPSDGEIAMLLLAGLIEIDPFPHESHELRSSYYDLVRSEFVTAAECNDLSVNYLIPRRHERDKMLRASNN